MAAFASSYIKTEGSQVTRAADAASMTGANFSSWYNQAEGTLYAEWDMYAFSAGGQARWTLSDGSSQNRLRARLAPSGTTQARHDVTNNGVIAVLGSPAGVQINGTKEAVSFASNAYTGLLNAGTASTSGTLVLPTITTLHIGSDVGAASFLNGHIRKLSYYPIRVSNTNLQALTS